MGSGEITRRGALALAAASGGVLAGGSPISGMASPAAAQDKSSASGPMAVVLHVNGTEHRLLLDPRTTLLDALREHLQLTAAAFVAGHALVIDGGQTV